MGQRCQRTRARQIAPLAPRRLAPDHHDRYPPDSGPNIESNIETFSENIEEVYPITTILTTSYISRGARIRTGDLLLPKQQKVNRQQPKPAILLGFRVLFDRQRPP